MWLWAWFTGGGWILVAGGAVVLGLVAAAVAVGATARKRDYPGRHVLAEYVEPYGFIGSMNLDDEREFLTTTPGTRMTIWAPSGEVEFSEEPSWLEQTAADLAPEALGQEVMPFEAMDAPSPAAAGHVSSGPGDFLGWPPGPDPDPGWLDRQLAGHVAWVARMAPMVTGWSVAA